MSIFTSILTSGTNSHQTTSEEANRFLTNFVTPGIVGAFTSTTGSFAVTAQSTPNNTVNVAVGDAVVNATPSTQANQNLNVRSNAAVTLTIAANTSGATRYDWIYLSVNATAANNPATDASDVASIVVNRSTSSTVDTVGAPAYAEALAMVTVANGFTSLAAGNITDLRRAAGAAVAPGSIGSTALASSAVIAGKIATKAVTPTTLGVPYHIHLHFTSNSSNLSNATWTPITYQAITFNNGFTTATSTGTAVTVPVAGQYRINLHNSYVNGTAGSDTLGGISVNSTTNPNRPWTRIGYNGGIPALEVNQTVDLAAGDVIRAFCYGNSSGNNLQLVGGSATGGSDGSWLEITYIGPSS